MSIISAMQFSGVDVAVKVSGSYYDKTKQFIRVSVERRRERE